LSQVAETKLGRRPRNFGLLVLVLAFVFVPPLVQKLLQTPLPRTELTLHKTPIRVPEVSFQNASGDVLTLQNFRGSFVLLNLWATWCAPCKQEMPSLDGLATKFSTADLQIVPLSIDVNGLPAVRYFYGEIAFSKLSIFVDPSMKAMRDLGVVGIPTTLLINREGLEVGRLIGPTQWDDTAIVEQLSAAIEFGNSLPRKSGENEDWNNHAPKDIGPDRGGPRSAEEGFSEITRELVQLGLF
jgi:thiol-disulfide isomerase/thioredoxin